MKKSMTFDTIRPFVRLAKQFALSRGNGFYAVCSYDVRLFFCTDGGGTIGAEERTFALTRGDLLILPPGCPYTFDAPTEDGNYIIVNFDYTQDTAHLKEPISPAPPSQFRRDAPFADIHFADEPILNKPFLLRKMHKLSEPLSRLVEILYHPAK